jgi:hypothetical protein
MEPNELAVTELHMNSIQQLFAALPLDEPSRRTLRTREKETRRQLHTLRSAAFAQIDLESWKKSGEESDDENLRTSGNEIAGESEVRRAWFPNCESILC